MPQSFRLPPLLRKPYPYSLNSPLTYLEIPPLWSGANPHPLWSLVGCTLTPLPPFPFFLSPMAPHFKYMSSYDDIAIKASHSPIHKERRDTVLLILESKNSPIHYILIQRIPLCQGENHSLYVPSVSRQYSRSTCTLYEQGLLKYLAIY
jgi:hypothetical protein